jgi:hypothetical protein
VDVAVHGQVPLLRESLDPAVASHARGAQDAFKWVHRWPEGRLPWQWKHC